MKKNLEKTEKKKDKSGTMKKDEYMTIGTAGRLHDNLPADDIIVHVRVFLLHLILILLIHQSLLLVELFLSHRRRRLCHRGLRQGLGVEGRGQEVIGGWEAAGGTVGDRGWRWGRIHHPGAGPFVRFFDSTTLLGLQQMTGEDTIGLQIFLQKQR